MKNEGAGAVWVCVKDDVRKSVKKCEKSVKKCDNIRKSYKILEKSEKTCENDWGVSKIKLLGIRSL